MKTFEKYIQKHLTKLCYKHISQCKTDLVATLRAYSCLAPSAETYVFETGEVEQLVNLGGTIPIKYKEETYNIPVKIWLRREHPDRAPFCHVLPTKDMELSVSPFISHSGLVELPCLSEWDPRTMDLNTFLQIARVTFSETPPVFAKPRVGRRRNKERDSVWEEHFPDEDEALLRTFFLKSASETCRSKLGEEFSRTKAEVDSLHQVNRDLIDRQEEIQNLGKTIQNKSEEAAEDVEFIRESLQVLKVVQEGREDTRRVTTGEVELLVQVPSQVHSRLLDAVANDEAIKDCIYALGQALENDKVTTEVYLKKVRELSRRQFNCRLLINSLGKVVTSSKEKVDTSSKETVDTSNK